MGFSEGIIKGLSESHFAEESQLGMADSAGETGFQNRRTESLFWVFERIFSSKELKEMHESSF